MEAARMINEPQDLAKEALIAAGHNSGCVPHSYFLNLLLSTPPQQDRHLNHKVPSTVSADMKQFVLNTLARIR
ncbi:hypothetical protein BTA51_16465 [Hahella sp. CCB-MM4]|uniref:hypothetical protein n=1 Tax=Hahella sp. (strain CCB-MM4) TaxID=1926491 RepID=UPI000BC5B64F|nr:hypothetical protein [Hahella sp. CCB-MM4]OZG72326.1 hypothetical protein BTA51_16465 [Hahella sp. CCB-MM4]